MSRATHTATILRLEGGVVLAFAVFSYHILEAPWLWFFVLLLVPDVFMVGYLAGSRVGAAVYNVGHTYLLPGLLAAAGIASGTTGLLYGAAIWTAHIGLDRLLGFGLKDATGFKDTHLQRV